MNDVGHIVHSAVIVRTPNDIEADISIIVHGADQRLTEVLHEVCTHAVRHAVRSFDRLTMDQEEQCQLEPLLRSALRPGEKAMEL